MDEKNQSVKQKTESFPDILQTVLIAFIYIGATVLLSFLLLALGFSMEAKSTYLILHSVPLMAAIAFGINRKKYFEGTYRMNFKIISSGAFAAVVLATISLGLVVDPLMNMIPIDENLLNVFASISDWSFLSFVLIVISPAILEETLFRGILLDGLAKKYGETKGILVSSILFGLVHLNLSQFVGATILGILMGWVYLRSRGSLTLVIVMHGVNNTLSWIQWNVVKAENLSEVISIRYYWILISAAALIFIVTINFLHKKLRPIESS